METRIGHLFPKKLSGEHPNHKTDLVVKKFDVESTLLAEFC